jgi:hypothetical protein
MKAKGLVETHFKNSTGLSIANPPVGYVVVSKSDGGLILSGDLIYSIASEKWTRVSRLVGKPVRHYHAVARKSVSA